MNKSIKQRQSYIIHKLNQLDKITDPYKYARRAHRVMHYNNLLMKINNKKIKGIVEGRELK